MGARVRVGQAEAVTSALDHLLALLDAGETERAARRRHAPSFVTAHALQRTLLGELLAVPPHSLRFARVCATCGSSRHGKPSVVGHPDLGISLSYTTSRAVVAASLDGEVGIDIELVSESDFAGFDRVTLAPEEARRFDGIPPEHRLQARARTRARKEAVLKATGYGLVVDPTDIVVSGPDEPPRLLAWRASQAPPAAVALADLEVSEDAHTAAVAVLTDAVLQVDLRSIAWPRSAPPPPDSGVSTTGHPTREYPDRGEKR